MLTIYFLIGLVIGVLGGWYITRVKLNTYGQTLQTKLEGVQQQLEEAKGGGIDPSP